MKPELNILGKRLLNHPSFSSVGAQKQQESGIGGWEDRKRREEPLYLQNYIMGNNKFIFLKRNKRNLHLYGFGGIQEGLQKVLGPGESMGEHRFLSVFLYSAAVTFHFRFCFINSSFLPVSKVTSMSTPRMAVFMAEIIPYTSLLSGHSRHLVCLLSHHYTFSLVKQTNKQTEKTNLFGKSCDST